MRMILFRITVKVVVWMLLTVGCGVCLADGLGSVCWKDLSCPWYFIPNKVTESWEFSRGENVRIDILDSEVNFSGPLTGKCAFTEKSYGHIEPDHDLAEYSHGTNMASLIAADSVRLPCEDEYGILYFCRRAGDAKIPVAGIAPDSKITDRVTVSRGKTVEAFLDAIRTQVPLDDKVFKEGVIEDDVGPVRLIIVNYSGGKAISKLTEEQKANGRDIWHSAMGERKGYLLIAAVGNGGVCLGNDTRAGTIPATLKTLTARNHMIRVGGTKVYGDNNRPEVSRGSNWGKDWVDVLAPGDEIAALHRNGKAEILSGSTSAATAIVTGTVALMAACEPNVGADELKRLLLQNADSYEHLEDYVNGGKVLNIHNAVKNFCLSRPVERLVTGDNESVSEEQSLIEQGGKSLLSEL